MTNQDELRAIITTIETTFGHDLDGWLTCFDAPLVFIAPEATLTFPDHATARPFFEQQWDALRAAGFASTHADDVTITSLAHDVALIDTDFTRRRADGSEMELLGALYVCRKKAEGWKVAALVRHPHGRANLSS